MLISLLQQWTINIINSFIALYNQHLHQIFSVYLKTQASPFSLSPIKLKTKSTINVRYSNSAATSPTESSCGKSIQKGSTSSSHQQQRDHTKSPAHILLPSTSSAKMASTRRSSAPSVSPPPLCCSPRLINEPRHCWGTQLLLTPQI